METIMNVQMRFQGSKLTELSVHGLNWSKLFVHDDVFGVVLPIYICVSTRVLPTTFHNNFQKISEGFRRIKRNMADGRDGENVIRIVGGDVGDNQGGKPDSATGYEDQQASVDATSNLINDYEDQQASVDATSNLINDGMAMNRLIPLDELYFKTKMCARFSSGTCYDPKCKFAHGIEDLRTLEQNCEEFGLAHQNKAPLSMLTEQFRIPSIGSSVFVMETERSAGRHCKRFHSEVGCPFGNKCTYAHDEQSKNRERTAIVVAIGSKAGHRDGGGSGNGGATAAVPSLLAAAAAAPARPPSATAKQPLAPLPLARVMSSATMKPSFRRTKICNKWQVTGDCPYGSQCIFAHGEAELQCNRGGRVHKVVNANKEGCMVPNTVAASGSSVVQAGGSGQPSGAPKRPWRGPRKINRIYGDWIDEE